MHSPRSHVADRKRERGRQLACHTQIPLHDIIALRFLLYIGTQARAWLLAELCISARGERACRQDIGVDRIYKRHRALEGEIEFVGQRQHVENTEATAHQSFSTARIPSEPDARLEIPKRRIVKEWRAHAR